MSLRHPVAGSILGTLSTRSFQQSEKYKYPDFTSFLIQVISSEMISITMPLELEILIEKRFHDLFSKKKPLKSDCWIQIDELSCGNFLRRAKLVSLLELGTK